MKNNTFSLLIKQILLDLPRLYREQKQQSQNQAEVLEEVFVSSVTSQRADFRIKRKLAENRHSHRELFLISGLSLTGLLFENTAKVSLARCGPF